MERKISYFVSKPFFIQLCLGACQIENFLGGNHTTFRVKFQIDCFMKGYRHVPLRRQRAKVSVYTFHKQRFICFKRQILSSNGPNLRKVDTALSPKIKVN